MDPVDLSEMLHMSDEMDRSLRRLPKEADELAPDGAEVRLLASTDRASMAHFRIQPGQVTRAVKHRGIDELWYVTSGDGDLWLQNQDAQEGRQHALHPGLSIAIRTGASFQCRNHVGGQCSGSALYPAWCGRLWFPSRFGVSNFTAFVDSCRH